MMYWLEISCAIFVCLLIFFPVIFFGIISHKTFGYGYKNNKEVFLKDVSLYEDIPCDNDIFFAYTLMVLNKFVYSENNILSAILLKWLKEGKILFRYTEDGKINAFDLSLNPTFENEIEKEIFDTLYKMSGEGNLNEVEFEISSINNSISFSRLFAKIYNAYTSKLRNNGLIYTSKGRKECKFENVMDDSLYNESVKLYGFKKYLQEYNDVHFDREKESDYLMFAYLFGVVDELLNKMKSNNSNYVYQIGNLKVSYDDLMYIYSFSKKIVDKSF